MKQTSIILLTFMIASLAFGGPSPMAKEHSERLLKSIKTDDFALFIQNAEKAFKKIDESTFNSVVTQLQPRLQEGYSVTYLGVLEQRGYDVTLWKIDFSEGDDALATLSIKDGKVGGYWIR